MKEYAIHALTRLARFLLTGPKTIFQFSRPHTLTIPKVKKSGLYVHIPFCRSLCPYCPYNRIRYDELLAERFLDALEKEIEFYQAQLPGIEISSVYFGGGTPTVIHTGLERITDKIRRAFRITGPVCVETNPADLTEEKVALLRSIGVHALSIGVQSFHQELLDVIGRKYTPAAVEQVLNWVTQAGFPTVNIDLMFALPRQTLAHLEADLKRATAHQIDQVTAYPLFTFPYSAVGRFRQIQHVKMPPISLRRRMYYFLYDYLLQQGYQRVSVWSFKRNAEAPRYSSVTREQYIGFGPGAGSYYGTSFHLNTFSVPAYIDSVHQRGEAVALTMPFTKDLQVMYDFYWRVYDTYIPFERQLDTVSYSVKDVKRLHWLIGLGRLLGMVERTEQHFALTRTGALWGQLLQNYFSLGYINAIWSVAKREAWPRQIRF